MTRHYAEAGVDLEGAEAAKARIGRAVATTRTPLSVGEVGAFGGAHELDENHLGPFEMLAEIHEQNPLAHLLGGNRAGYR